MYNIKKFFSGKIFVWPQKTRDHDGRTAADHRNLRQKGVFAMAQFYINGAPVTVENNQKLLR